MCKQKHMQRRGLALEYHEWQWHGTFLKAGQIIKLQEVINGSAKLNGQAVRLMAKYVQLNS